MSDAPDDDGASPRGAATQDTVAPAPAVDHDALCGALVSELAGVTAAALVDLSIAAQVGRHALDADAHAALDALTSIVVEFFDGATLATFEDRVGEDAVYAIVLSTAVAHRVLRGFGDRYVVALVVPTTHPLDPVRHRLEALLPGLAANLT